MKMKWLLPLAAISNVFSQAPAIDWQKTLGGDKMDLLYSVLATPDGGYIMSGLSLSGISGDKEIANNGDNGTGDYWVIKINSLREIEWQRALGGIGGDGNNHVILTSDGGYLVSGDSVSDMSGDKTEDSYGLSDYWIVKLDGAGNIQWDKTLGGDDDDHYPFAVQAPDGGYLIGGTSSSTVSGVKTEDPVGYTTPQSGIDDYWILKLDPSGNILWQNTIGGTTRDELRSVLNTDDGGFLLSGISRSGIGGDKTEASRGELDYWIVKVDGAGAVVWQRTIGGSLADILFTSTNTDDGGYLVGGASDSGISGEKSDNVLSPFTSDMWILKLDNSGAIVWQKTIGGTGSDFLHEIVKDGSGNFLLAGNSDSDISFNKTENSKGGIDFWMVKIDGFGNILWDKTVGGEENEGVYGASYIPYDNSFIVGGPSLSSNTGDKTEASRGLNDYWIVKLEPENLSTTAFAAASIEVYPNPVTKDVHIAFPKACQSITVKIIDIAGQVVQTSVFQNTANATVAIDAQAGMYFIETENENGEKSHGKVMKL